MKNSNKRKAFTLAEVLITLAVIGVVAAMTLPTLISSLHTKAMDRKEQVFNQRLTNGIREMAVKSRLTNFDTTYDFAKELSNHYKIFGIYNTDNIASAYPVGEVIINNTGKTLKVSAIKRVENLNLENNEKHEWSEPVAIVTTDGTPFIFSYNKKCSLSESDINEDMQKGSGTGKITECIAGVYDRNGVKPPNKQDVDIISFNGGSIGKGCIEANGMCVANIGMNYQPVNCSSSNRSSSDYKYCTAGSNIKGYTNDYWAGAVKACSELGMSLPSLEKLSTIHDNKSSYKLASDRYISNSVHGAYGYAFAVDFGSNYNGGLGNDKTYKANVACIDK